MIFSTGEGDSAVLHAKGSRCGVDRFLRGVDELGGDVQGKGNVGSSHQRGENQKRCYKPAHSPGSEEPCDHTDDLLPFLYAEIHLCTQLVVPGSSPSASGPKPSRSYPKSPGDLGPVIATTGTTSLHLPYKAKGFLQDIETGIFVPAACVATGRVCTPITALGNREIGSKRTAPV